MFKIGLTGNIGSGKSVISKIFKTIGTPVFDADFEAKLLLKSAPVKEDLRVCFGNGIFWNGEIDRKQLANIVFNNKTALEKLNDIIHPAVRSKFEHWLTGQIDSFYVIYEAAIIFESGFYKYLDKTINISANEIMRIDRVMKRDNVTREMVLSRMTNQWPDDKKCTYADFVIKNENEELLIPQILELHNKLLLLSKKG